MASEMSLVHVKQHLTWKKDRKLSLQMQLIIRSCLVFAAHSNSFKIKLIIIYWCID